MRARHGAGLGGRGDVPDPERGGGVGLVLGDRRMKFSDDVFVYLSGPITAKYGYTVEQNVAQALKVYLDCLRAGVTCFCPHLSGAFPSAFDVPYETWLA